MSGTVLPQLDELNRPFWNACRDGALVLQRCVCGHLRYPIAPFCSSCLSGEYAWEAMTGRGEIYSFTVFRHVYSEAWRDRIPYVVALVKLDEGPTMISNIVEARAEEVHVGLSVRVVFDRLTDQITVPRFAKA
jgi:uncharacterized protein